MIKNKIHGLFAVSCLLLFASWLIGCGREDMGSYTVGTAKLSEETRKKQAAKDNEHSSETMKSAVQQTEKVSETETKKPVPGMDSEYLILVNKNNLLEEDYQVELATVTQGGVQVANAILEELNAMIEAAAKEGHTLIVCSAYRTQERQQTILDRNIANLVQQGLSYTQAYHEVTREVMPAGHSEHATGLAIDITGEGNQRLDEGQEQTAENQWLREHCSEYGFILRYPKNKEKITEIDYEPWHFRYVGREAAKYMTEQKLTLEEYLELK